MYFGEVINSWDDLKNQKSKFHFSSRGLDALDGEWWDEHKEEIEGHKIVCSSFTDYGGDFVDNMVYRKAKEIDDAHGAAATEEVWNNARGYGKPYVMGGNAIIFGELADKICEGDKLDVYSWYSALGDFDEDYSKIQDEFINREIEYLKNEYKEEVGELTDEDTQFLYDWIVDHGQLQATNYDYSTNDAIEALNDFRGKQKDAPGQEHFEFDKDYIDNPDNQKNEETAEQKNECGDANVVSESNEDGAEASDKIQLTKFAIATGSTILDKLYGTRNAAQQDFMANSALHDPKNPYKVVKVTISYDI